jgi:hypothetical protein
VASATHHELSSALLATGQCVITKTGMPQVPDPEKAPQLTYLGIESSRALAEFLQETIG